MSSNKMVNLQVTEEQAQVLQAFFALLPNPEAPSTKVETKVEKEVQVEDCTAKRKDGEDCGGKALRGRDVCVAHAKGVTKKATTKKATTKRATKVAPTKSELLAQTTVTLRKATRKDFVKAVKAEFGVDLTGLSTKEVARWAITEGEVPTGFEVGKGYRELVG